MGSWAGFAYVASGGAAGAALRYFLSLVFERSTFGMPIATLLSNLAGCFLLGLFLQLGLGATVQTHPGRLLLATGFCGGFTTMSAFVLELSNYLRTEQPFHASVYFVATLAGAMLSFYLGIAVARMFLKHYY